MSAWPKNDRFCLTSLFFTLDSETHQMRNMKNMKRLETTNVYLFLQWVCVCVCVCVRVRARRPPAQLCRGWGRTFPEREPGLALAPGAHVTPPPTPHFSRELPKPNPAQDRIMCTG